MPVDEAGTPAERVHIVYQASTGSGREEKELPLKLLVLGDFTGRADRTPIEERKAITVTRDTLDDVLASQQVRLQMAVPDRLGEAGNELPVTLRLSALRDFAPEALARQVPELRQLLDLREAIVALKGPLGELPAFRDRIHAIIADPAARAALLAELGRA